MSDEKKPKTGPKLKAEVRAYTVSEADLAEWLTGAAKPEFFVVKIETLSTGDFEFTVSTEKQAERTIVERPGHRTVNEERATEGLPPIEEPDDPPTEAEQTGGPQIVDDRQPVGKADPMPQIAPRREGMKVDRFKTKRELALEAQKRSKEPRITHIEDGSDDPVPSAIPR